MAAREGISILVVDDEEQIRKLLKLCLAANGYKVHEAESASAALEVLHQEEIHLVIADYRMPEMSGLDLAREILKIYSSMPVVIITGYGTLPLAVKAVREGAIDFVKKPFDIRELPLIVEKNIERKRAESRIVEDNKATVLYEAIMALASAVDAKDPYTAGHSKRVAGLSLVLAEELNMSEGESFVLKLSALMHDVGKIGVPDYILQVTTGLAVEDYELMKLHAVRGGEIVGEIRSLSRVADIIRHHHEWVNGNGYPDGLQGFAIPMLSKIISIADAFDAMTSKRSYRGALSREQAMEQLRQGAGTQFDSWLVDIFIQSLSSMGASEAGVEVSQAEALDFD